MSQELMGILIAVGFVSLLMLVNYPQAAYWVLCQVFRHRTKVRSDNFACPICKEGGNKLHVVRKEDDSFPTFN